jgi:hypothetical protein
MIYCTIPKEKFLKELESLEFGEKIKVDMLYRGRARQRGFYSRQGGWDYEFAVINHPKCSRIGFIADSHSEAVERLTQMLAKLNIKNYKIEWLPLDD